MQPETTSSELLHLSDLPAYCFESVDTAGNKIVTIFTPYWTAPLFQYVIYPVNDLNQQEQP
jgi:hypothetical protein